MVNDQESNQPTIPAGEMPTSPPPLSDLVGETRSLDDILAGTRDAVQAILTEPTAEEVSRERVLGVDEALRVIVANSGLRDFLTAYHKKTGEPGEVPLLRETAKESYTIGSPILTILPDGAIKVIFNPSNTEPSRVYPMVRLMPTKILPNGDVKVGEGDRWETFIKGGNIPSDDLVKGGSALIKIDHADKPDFFADDIELSPQFGHATAKLINTTLSRELTAMGKKLAPTTSAQVSPAPQSSI